MLPPDLRDWLPEDDLAHFVVEAVERVPLERFQVNERGTGSAQYHPRMMLALLVPATRTGSSARVGSSGRRIGTLAVRYVAANCHPDHDTICTFRRSNDAVAPVPAGTAAGEGAAVLLRCWDGERGRGRRWTRTRISATASVATGLHTALRQLRGASRGCCDQAEHADTDAAPDPQGLPEELSRRDKLREAGPCVRGVGTACAGACGLGCTRAEYERKVAARERTYGIRKGRHIKPPTEAPEAEEQINLTDADSPALMRKSRRHEYRTGVQRAAGGPRCRRQSVGVGG